jgi:hypothetical protein
VTEDPADSDPDTVEANADENVEATMEDSAALTVGNWSLLGGGQCLVAAQRFYPRKFGISVPLARGTATGACAAYGACHLWLDNIPSPAHWTRIANTPGARPRLYDMIVYPPIGANHWGHVAMVDHVDSAGRIFVMDSNFNYTMAKSVAPHTIGWKAYGWYRPR